MSVETSIDPRRDRAEIDQVSFVSVRSPLSRPCATVRASIESATLAGALSTVQLSETRSVRRYPQRRQGARFGTRARARRRVLISREESHAIPFPDRSIMFREGAATTRAARTSRSTSASKEIPIAAHSSGNRLVGVRPGRAFVSRIYGRPSRVTMNRSASNRAIRADGASRAQAFACDVRDPRRCGPALRGGYLRRHILPRSCRIRGLAAKSRLRAALVRRKRRTRIRDFDEFFGENPGPLVGQFDHRCDHASWVSHDSDAGARAFVARLHDERQIERTRQERQRPTFEVERVPSGRR